MQAMMIGKPVCSLYAAVILRPWQRRVAVVCNEVKPSPAMVVEAAKWRGHNKRAAHAGTYKVFGRCTVTLEPVSSVKVY